MFWGKKRNRQIDSRNVIIRKIKTTRKYNRREEFFKTFLPRTPDKDDKKKIIKLNLKYSNIAFPGTPAISLSAIKLLAILILRILFFLFN